MNKNEIMNGFNCKNIKINFLKNFIFIFGDKVIIEGKL